MREHVRGDVGDVAREHVVTATQQGDRAGRGDEAEGSAGADAVLEHAVERVDPVPMRMPGGHHELHGVHRDRVVHEDLLGLHLQAEHVRGAQDLLCARPHGAHPLDDREFLELIGVVDVHLQQEPVPLRFGSW